MIIDSPSDYKFVQGISNGEVLINGQIMPWRDVNHPSATHGTFAPCCLRGEDKCFLWEKKTRMDRLRFGHINSAVSQGSYQMQYTPNLDWLQLVDIAASWAYHNNWTEQRGAFFLSGDFSRDTTTLADYIAGNNFAAYGSKTILDAYNIPIH